MTTILLLGSSHICKFENFIKKKGTVNPFQLVTPRPRVKFLGISGGRMNKPGHIRQFEDAVQIIRPDKIIIQIGGNVLDCKDIPGPDRVQEREQFIANFADKLISTSRTLVNKPGVQHIIIAQLLPHYDTRHCDPVIYNDCVISVNRLLKCKLSGIPNIHYWKLKGLKQSNNLFTDGVHLSTASQRKYYKNIRGTIIHNFNA